MEQKEIMIRLKGITKAFPQKKGTLEVLHGIDLDIEKGEIFGIIGLSGAGKSTLVRCINLLERPTEGQVFLDGQELTCLSEKDLRQARRSMGMIFQQFHCPQKERRRLQQMIQPRPLLAFNHHTHIIFRYPQDLADIGGSGPPALRRQGSQLLPEFTGNKNRYGHLFSSHTMTSLSSMESAQTYRNIF